jgi:hypothetical protein
MQQLLSQQLEFTEELHNVHTTSNIIRLMKGRKMRWKVEEECKQNFGAKARRKETTRRN